MGERTYITTMATCTKATDKAIKVKTAKGEGWVPVKCIASQSEVRKQGDTGRLVFSAWLLGQEGKEFLNPDGSPDDPASPPAASQPSGVDPKAEVRMLIQRIAADSARLKQIMEARK